MEKHHQQLITSNLVRLTGETNMDLIGPLLNDKGIFPPNGLDYIMSKPTVKERNMELYLTIQKRGPHAFDILIGSLVESGHFELARLLKPDLNVENYFAQLHITPAIQTRTSNGNNNNNIATNNELRGGTVPLPPERHETPVDWDITPLTIRVVNGTYYYGPPEKKAYQMFAYPRGHALIINNILFDSNTEETRTGAEVDSINMKALWEAFHFKIIYKENLGIADMRNAIRSFSALPEHAEADAAVIVIMSHGYKDTICASDGNYLDEDWVIRHFNNANCPLLMDKPKLFFFQACRGSDKDLGVKKTAVMDGRFSIDSGSLDVHAQTMVVKNPTQTDMLIAHPTVHGYVAIRDKYKGSWFVECICTVFMEHAHDTDLEAMMKLVSEKMKTLTDDQGRKQMCTTLNIGVTKAIYFNPGLYRGMLS